MPGWFDGHIVLKSGCLVGESGLVTKIKYNGPIHHDAQVI